jgi:hypothetical protein
VLTVTNDNNGLFSAQPAIDGSGVLTFTPAANAFGMATVTVTLMDNGGTANGGDDTRTVTFDITVNSVNDAPSFTLSPDDTVLEDAGAQIVPAFASNISIGPANEAGQTAAFNVTGNTNSALFSVQPSIDASGNLTYTPAADANGSADVTVNLMDDGGTANGGDDTSDSQTFTINVISVNDAPSFNVQGSHNSVEDAGQQTVALFATNISRGPADEAGQGVIFELIPDNAALFTQGPSINASGTLTYTAAPNASGSTTVTVRLHDTGGTANGGVDTSGDQTFDINIAGDNDAPEVVAPVGPQTLSDASTTPFVVDLNNVFNDPEGDALIFDAVSSNTALVTVQRVGGIVTISRVDYFAKQDRTPATITVTATEAAAEGLSAMTTFVVTVDPNPVGEIRMIAVAAPTADLDLGEGSLPNSLTEVTVGTTYFVEFWLTDRLDASVTAGDPSTGLLGSFVDTMFDPTLGSVTALDHDTLIIGGFILPKGTIDNPNGIVTEFGSSTNTLGIGLNGNFARLGHFEVTAGAAGTQEFSIDFGAGVNTQLGRHNLEPVGTELDFSQIDAPVLSVTQTGGPPLTGEDGGGPPAGETGSTVYSTIVKNRTTVNGNGEVNSLPESEPWLDEWDSYWVELWGHSGEGTGITSATFDLNYNPTYFTATEIDHGRTYRGNAAGTIDDQLGFIDDLGGFTEQTGRGQDGYVLLSRVKFEALADNQVPINSDGYFVGPYDLGLQLSDLNLDVAGAGSVIANAADIPQTELWAVPFDVNDDDRISLTDVSYLSSVFAEAVADSESPYSWLFDVDRSGVVSLNDVAYVGANFGARKGDGSEVLFPNSFLQRWAGSATSGVGDNTLDEVLEAASATWQTALGLEDPISIQFVVSDLGGTQLGEGRALQLDEDGRPTAGRVVIDDDAAGLGWFLDVDSSEFVDSGDGTSYVAAGGSEAEGRYDLYTVLLHEIGHALGFGDFYSAFASQITTAGDGSLIFNGPGFTANIADDGLHVDSTAHAGDLMTSTLGTSMRRLPSALDIDILMAAYAAAESGATLDGSVAAPQHGDLQAAETFDAAPALQQHISVDNGVTDSDVFELPRFSFSDPDQLRRAADGFAARGEKFTRDRILPKLQTEKLARSGIYVVDADETETDWHQAFRTHDHYPGDFGPNAEAVPVPDSLEDLDSVFSGWDGPIL